MAPRPRVQVVVSVFSLKAGSSHQARSSGSVVQEAAGPRGDGLLWGRRDHPSVTAPPQVASFVPADATLLLVSPKAVMGPRSR
ncbi:hypothetical protein NDU88_006400 [Pleurodeles waltl]|uniref:Uncharacterized protein n=1 Tax=Pleurodeles waltl TaxID=8319 RepID=A0AAV7TDB8_PLEWA|nr:hypothetical protein NDU88_006400 [Pleurodeles waltl]